MQDGGQEKENEGAKEKLWQTNSHITAVNSDSKTRPQQALSKSNEITEAARALFVHAHKLVGHDCSFGREAVKGPVTEQRSSCYRDVAAN